MASTADDLVVIGGGMAGLVAAARAAELGLQVAVLERGVDEHYPCNARWSGGVLHVGYTDIVSPPEMLADVIARATEGEADRDQAETMAGNAGRLVGWLAKHGATYVGTKVGWQQFILEPMRAMRAGLDWEGRGPDLMMGRLAAVVRRSGGRILLGARARALAMEGRRCVGVEAEIGGRRQVFAARAVIIADGGFQANMERLGRHITANPDKIKQRGAANGTGDGLAMAEAVGAAVAGMDRFYGHILSRDALANDKVWPYPELDALALTNAIARSADPLGATIVFDAAIWEGPGRSARIPANPTLEAAGGTVLRADTLEGLARLAGLPAAALAGTIGEHNGALAEGTFAGLEPARTTTRHKPMAILRPPFLAIPICAGITYTMGGLRIDGRCRVIRDDGSAIEGLYAAGSTTGGLEGGGQVAYLGGLAKAGLQGLVAAESIAEAATRA